MFFIFLVIAYILGSVPTGVIIGLKLKGIDIREHGSKNTGATNAYRVLGKKYGLMVLLADMMKGFIPVMLAQFAGIGGNKLLVVGIVTIVGHTLSIFLNFKGGKGVATSLGVFLYLVPNVTFVLVIVFIVITYFTRYVSLGSVTCAAIFPILTLFMPVRESLNKTGIFIVSLIMGIFVIYKHKTNIKRLLSGTENKI